MKGHEAIREFIRLTAESLSDDLQFFYAKTSDFNQLTDVNSPSIVLDPLSAVPQYTDNGVTNYMKAWSCNMAFYKFDREGSTPEQYAKLLDETDSLVDKFINKINFYSYKSDSIVIQNINQSPFIKATSKIMTGHILTFTLLAQDDFDYCADDLNCEVTEDEC